MYYPQKRSLSESRWIDGEADLSDVDESTHQVLVAECIYGLLGLFPRRVFHNTKDSQSDLHNQTVCCSLTRIPT